MKILSIRKKVPKTAHIPDGYYKGLWGSNVITMTYNKEEFELETEEGVRGMNIPVVVIVKEGEATFQTLGNK